MAAFATQAGELSGRWAAAELPRLMASQTPPQDVAPADVQWTTRGERRVVAGGDDELWLALSAQTAVWQTCQRCLQPFERPLAVDARVRFVRDEAQAEVLDAELEEDVLALPRWLDLRELVEDELLLALPLVPRHERCPRPLPLPAADLPGEAAEAEQRPNPFAVLRALKDGKATKAD